MSETSPSRALEEAREYEERMERFIGADERPRLHLTPRVGWMNDPNGFSFYNGEYHLFYQYYPYISEWGPMHWGHAVSPDLLHWTYLPAAMAPDQSYDDKGGCFSGSAAVLPDGRHLLMYTGVAAGPRADDGRLTDLQTQCVALGDGRDYVKYEGNPVITTSMLPEGSNPEHFRDPKIWQDEQGRFHCVVANLASDGHGQILRFGSDDGFAWEGEGVVAHDDGTYGAMWECPDLFELDGHDVLLVSPQDMLPEGHEFIGGNGTLALVGHLDEAGRLQPESARSVDCGIDFYATQTMLTPDGRRVMVAWMQNWDTIVMGKREDRYFGRMTIPRELSVRGGKLFQWPVRELDAQRSNHVTHRGMAFEGRLSFDDVRGRCTDLLVDVRPESEDALYEEFALWFAEGDGFHTSLRFRPSTGELKLNRAHAGIRRAVLNHRKCDLPGTGGNLRLRVVLDRDCAEVFVNGGERTMSITIPTPASADDITFFAQGRVVMDVEKYDLA